MVEVTNGSSESHKAPLEELMVAMDVVDTLRHDQSIAERELDGESRRERLLERLRGIALSVDPNPTSSTAMLEFNTHQPFDVVSVDLLDLTGRHMWNGLEGALPAVTYRFEVPTAQLAQGNYLLVVEADGRRSATQLMVK